VNPQLLAYRVPGAAFWQQAPALQCFADLRKLDPCRAVAFFFLDMGDAEARSIGDGNLQGVLEGHVAGSGKIRRVQYRRESTI
jgi:hypothetical protein